ncbi:protein kinase [Plantactinospora sp. BB1]|uniref:protein kinase domain-containing protein n=1 Tax=Plantactinospora sp. BB1 TaxID=2071627 RepID=UPI00131EEA5E|nr:protein kinase [Plantactinospora sp. BB1]
MDSNFVTASDHWEWVLPKKIAVLVGIDDYSGRWAKLNCSVNDVSALSAVLAMEEYGYFVHAITNEEATKAAVIRAVLEAKSGGFESVLFYFSGHGVATDFGTYLVTHDNAEFDEGLELRKLVELLSSGKEDDGNLLILDCCHSGTAAVVQSAIYNFRSLLNPDILDALRPGVRSVAVMAACLSDQLAWEERNSGHGIFTYYLLQGLIGEAVDHQGNLTANTLYDFVSRNMSSHGPYGDERQKPVFGGHVAGRLLIGTGLTPALPPPLPEDEFREIERAAAGLIDEYAAFKSKFTPDEWRTIGHGECSRKLETIDKWFTKKAAIPGLEGRVQFKKSLQTLLRYRIELGYVEEGTRIPEGELEERIGEGGFGAVWKVVDRDSGKRVALKIYHPHENYDGAKSRRFENGYDAMRMLAHPQIVGVYRYSRCPTGFVMDYIDGPNLRTLELHAFMEPVDLLRILVQIADAIDYAHRHDVIHRDIKPENIVCELQEDGTWKPFLTDFDLAWFSTNTQRATKTAMGVVHYAAPEQFFSYDPKAALAKTPALDVFSFGQLLYYSVTGQDPNPVDLDGNAERLRDSAFRKGFDSSSALSLAALYEISTVWNSAERIRSFTPIIQQLKDVEASLLHTSAEASLDKDEFIAELISSLSSRPVPVRSATSFISSAGTWEISFEWQDKRFRGKGYMPLLKTQYIPQRRIAFQNTSNEQMRRVLNRRLDDALKPYAKFVTRRPGTHGTYQVYVDIRLEAISRENVKKAVEVITTALSALTL